MPDIPDARGLTFPPVNKAEKNAIAEELRRREHERNIQAIASRPEMKWYEKPHGIILIGVIIVVLGYFATEFISSLKQKSQHMRQQTPATVLPNDPKDIPHEPPTPNK